MWTTSARREAPSSKARSAELRGATRRGAKRLDAERRANGEEGSVSLLPKKFLEIYNDNGAILKGSKFRYFSFENLFSFYFYFSFGKHFSFYFSFVLPIILVFILVLVSENILVERVD